MPIITLPSAPIRNDRKNEPNIEPVLPNGFAMKLVNAKKIGMKDKRKRRNPTIRNAIPSCRSRGPDSPKSVAPPGIAAPGPPTILAPAFDGQPQDRKSTRLNSSHVRISYAVFCLKKKKKQTNPRAARSRSDQIN